MEPTQASETSGSGAAHVPSIGGLAAATQEARDAASDLDAGPADPTQFSALLSRLGAARSKLPETYRTAVVEPYIHRLTVDGEARFNQTLEEDPERTSNAGLMLDIAQAILQQGEGFLPSATDAFQEVVSDLYDGFLSAEDRRDIKPPDRGVIPPLVKWGHPKDGPYTWPVDDTSYFDIQAAIVNLPPTNAHAGLLAWSALGHETAGHDILHADIGLADELAAHVGNELLGLGDNIARYWSTRLDETASDVMGLLNIGPAAGIGLIGYFRALSGTGRLRSNSGRAHPADVLRGFLAAEVVSQLRFSQRAEWATLIRDETLRDAVPLRMEGQLVSIEDAQRSAKIVAKALVEYKADSLEGHALGEIQNWRDRDEVKVLALRQALRDGTQPTRRILQGTYAAHVVAAAVVEAVSGASPIPLTFTRMLAILKAMHDKNPAWGPLFFQPQALLARHFVFERSTQVEHVVAAVSEPQPVASV